MQRVKRLFKRQSGARRRAAAFFKTIPWRYCALGFLSAALLVLSFPSYSVWWLGFVGLVPFLVGLGLAPGFREMAWMGMTHSVSFILLGFGWISYVVTNFGGMPWIVGKIVLGLFSLFGEIQFAAFGLTAFALIGRVSAHGAFRRPFVRVVVYFVTLPTLYIGLDFLNPKIFPNTLGHVLYSWFPVAQTAEYFGVFGLTVPLLLSNLALAVLVIKTLRRRGSGLPLGPAAQVFPGAFSAAMVLGLVCFALSQAHVWGSGRIAELEALERSWSRSLRVSVIQGNIGDVEKLASEQGYEPAIQRVLNAYKVATLYRVRKYEPDLVIWPETSFPFLYTHFQDPAANRSGAARDQWMKDFMADIRTPLFFGSYSSVGRRDYNSAFLLKPPFELASVYRKHILLAFGEYIPLGPLSPLLLDMLPMVANFGRGEGPQVIDVKGVKLGPQICYEGIFPEHSRGSAQLGADILLNVTNDSWFGRSTEPWLHLLLTVFRSIELRRPMIRSTNTGVSTIVDLTGRMRFNTRLFEEAEIDAAIAVPGPGQKAPETFYFKYGEVFARACTVLALALALYAWGPLLAGSVGGKLSTSRRRRKGSLT